MATAEYFIHLALHTSLNASIATRGIRCCCLVRMLNSSACFMSQYWQEWGSCLKIMPGKCFLRGLLSSVAAQKTSSHHLPYSVCSFPAAHCKILMPCLISVLWGVGWMIHTRPFSHYIFSDMQMDLKALHQKLIFFSMREKSSMKGQHRHTLCHIQQVSTMLKTIWNCQIITKLRMSRWWHTALNTFQNESSF